MGKDLSYLVGFKQIIEMFIIRGGQWVSQPAVIQKHIYATKKEQYTYNKHVNKELHRIL